MRVAVVGATGAVGVEMLKVLEERDFPLEDLVLFASPRSQGKEIMWRGAPLNVRVLKEGELRGFNIALFSAGGDISKQFAREASNHGCVVIDNSSAFRMNDAVPLVVPEINPEEIDNHNGIIANPNCSTIISLMALHALHKKFELTGFIASTYQAASGAGEKGMYELASQVSKLENGEDIDTPEVFPYQLAENLIPRIGTALPNGSTTEEEKMLYESRKILSLPRLMVDATCVRVPVPRVHSISITASFRQKISEEEAREALRQAPGIELEDDVAKDIYPMPINYTGKYKCGVGRIRKSKFCTNGLNLWVVGDQVLKGAALNAVQIAELLKV